MLPSLDQRTAGPLVVLAVPWEFQRSGAGQRIAPGHRARPDCSG